MSQKTLAIFAVFILIAGMFLVSAEAPIGNSSDSSEATTQTEATTSVQTYIKGDLNKDGKVTPEDLNILIDHLYESLNPLPNAIDYEIADMDNDNNLDISDITALIQKLIDLGYFKDAKAPEIKLVSPSDNSDFTTSKSFKTINFRYQVTDESNIASCKLIVDGYVEETDNSVERNITNSFSIDVDRGSHDWKISCKDTKGNEGFSSIRDFDIDKESSSTNTDTNNVITTLSNKATTTPTKDTDTKTNSTNTITAKPTASTVEFNWMYVLFGILVAMIIVLLIMIMVVGRR
ncbi:MAG: dockerin type I repeat-containing protein [Nanoarchaeota archaeon]